MTNQVFNPQPCYSGVTIQIANPMVNAGIPAGNVNPNYANVYPGYITSNAQNTCRNGECRCNTGYYGVTNPHSVNTASSLSRAEGQYGGNSQISDANYLQENVSENQAVKNIEYIRDSRRTDLQTAENSNFSDGTNFANENAATNPNGTENYPSSYPAQYYINNYGNGGIGVNGGVNNGITDGVNDGTNNAGFDANSKDAKNYKQSSVNRNGSSSEVTENKNERTTSNRNVNGVNNGNYDYNQRINDNNIQHSDNKSDFIAQAPDEIYDNNQAVGDNVGHMNNYKIYADKNEQKPESDMLTSQTIIEDLDQRVAEQEAEKKNTKETKIVALTDEYIKSLENYLNNPNDEIRLMASKEILTRLDEDHDRYNDAALNALLNKMLQDPAKLVRIAALSAFASQLACGNDYTVQLLHNIQANPNADKEDVLQAADILLKMSAGVEIKNIPNPSVKNNEQQETGK